MHELENALSRGDADAVADAVGRLRREGTPVRLLLQAGVQEAMSCVPADRDGAAAMVALSAAAVLADDEVDPGRSLLVGRGLCLVAELRGRGIWQETPTSGVDSRPETLDQAMAVREPLVAAGAVLAASNERGPAAARWLLYRAASRVFSRSGEALVAAVWYGRLLDRLGWGEATPALVAHLMCSIDRLQNPSRMDAEYWHPAWPTLPEHALAVRRGRRPAPAALADVLGGADVFGLDTTVDMCLRSGMDVDAFAEAVIVAAAGRLVRARRRDTIGPPPSVLWLGEASRALVLAQAARAAWRDAPSTETLIGVWQAARYHVETAWIERAQWDPDFYPHEPPPGANGELLLSTTCASMRAGLPGLATTCADSFQRKWAGHSVLRDATKAHISRGIGTTGGLGYAVQGLALAAAVFEEMRRPGHQTLLLTALVRTLASPDVGPDTARGARLSRALASA
jgi:hypothetical protein